MQKRISVMAGVATLLFMPLPPTFAADKIQAFINPAGRVVFMNPGENSQSISTRLAASLPAAPPGGVPEALHLLVGIISETHGVDPALVTAVMRTESNFDRWAVSPKGARGLMQLIPATGHRFGVTDFFDPRQNIEGGVRYLKFLLNKFAGNLDLSLAAYNAGENLVERLGRVPSIPETVNYVRKIRSIYTPAPPAAKAALSQIFRTVDLRGVTHFSNIEPQN